MVPFNLAKRISVLYEPSIELSQVINVSSASDLEVGINCLKVATLSAYYNVRTNLHDCSDEDFKERVSCQLLSFDDTEYAN